jgi:hypothetical protein
MTEKLHICPVCNSQMFQRFNSTLFYCPTCENRKKNLKARECKGNGEIMPKNALKSKKGNIDKQLDNAWSLLVKLKAGNKCEYCGNRQSLNSHHLNSRAKMSVRWDVNNGICLCVNHHIGSEFSAHKTSIQFTVWLIKYKGQKFMDDLQWKSNQTNHLATFEKEILLNELLNEIKSLN